jgi:aldose 1-epimerase
MIEQLAYGVLSDGTAIDRFILANRRGMRVAVITYGGIVTSIDVPDRAGNFRNVVLGFDALDGYFALSPYFGAIIGRYANRIARGRFSIDGIEYAVPTNDGPNSLHGGHRGFDKVVWKEVEAGETADGAHLLLHHLSPEGDEGYPGNLKSSVQYTLNESNELRIEYAAETDRPTIVNLTNHSYFNLAGAGAGDALGHELMINADAFTPVDATSIPTGEIRPVAGTPFDFRQATTIGARIRAADDQLGITRGYDHNWVLRRSDAHSLSLAARVVEPRAGRVLEIHTTEPGLQFYSGNLLDGRIVGTGDVRYRQSDGFCLETQHFPDSPNHPSFPLTVLRPGETYRTATVFRFSTV